MPSLAIQFNTKVGPLIQVAIFEFGFKPQPTAPPLSPRFYMGLVDTGASCTCITDKVIKDVGLSPVGKQQVGGVHGSSSTNGYQFQLGLVFPQSQAATGVINADITMFEINGIEFVPIGGFDVLVGRDIICGGRFLFLLMGMRFFQCELNIMLWTGIDADSKLIVSWLVGGRDGQYAMEFMDDVAKRLANRVQLTSDGHRTYLEAVEGAFGADVDYVQLNKLYGTSPESAKGRYSPAECIGARKERIEGNPDPKHVSTSYAEVHNRTMRMSMRRFTKLTNAHSKKLANHCHALGAVDS